MDGNWVNTALQTQQQLGIQSLSIANSSAGWSEDQIYGNPADFNFDFSLDFNA